MSVEPKSAPPPPVPIPANDVPDMEYNASQSPSDLPTPPDLAVEPGAQASAPSDARELSHRYAPMLAKSRSGGIENKGLTASLGPLYRSREAGSMAGLPGASMLRYPGFRPLGLSGFRMSAERQMAEADEDDTDMAVDDVFSPAAGNVSHDMDPESSTSPALMPRSLENEEAVPPLEETETMGNLSLGSPDGAAAYSRSPISAAHRASFRTYSSQPRSVGSDAGLSVSAGSASSRPAPYSIPSRSPGPSSSFGHTRSGATPMPAARASVPRLTPLTARRGAPGERYARRPQYLTSVSAPGWHTRTMFDDDETDEELDGDATEDETEGAFASARASRQARPLLRHVPVRRSLSRSPSPLPAADMHALGMPTGDLELGDEDARRATYATDVPPEMRYRYALPRWSVSSAGPASTRSAYMPVPRRPSVPAHGRPAYAPYGNSLPTRMERLGSWGGMYPKYAPAPGSGSAMAGTSPDGAHYSQVHLAAAALDRLSMAGYSREHERGDVRPTDESLRASDKSEEVAAIRDRLGGAANCSAFISKLWHLMINPQLYSKYIRWNEAGDTIILCTEPEVANEFAAEVLPKLFKHGNNASFVRQLNLYGFQRVSSSRLLDPLERQTAVAKGLDGRRAGAPAPNTALEFYGAHSSFAHPRFRRGQEEWLSSMKPRSSKKPKKPPAYPEAGEAGAENKVVG